MSKLILPSKTINYDQPVSQHTLNDGLISWYKVLPQWFGGTEFRDLKGQNHGQLGNLDVSTDWVRGGVGGNGGFLTMNGVNAYVILPDSIDDFNTEASLVFWVRLVNSVPTVDTKTGFVKLTETGDRLNSSHYPWIDGFAYLSTFKNSRINGISLSSTVNRAEWHMVSITSTPGAGGWKLYQNTELVTTDVGEPSINLNNTEGFWLGRSDTLAADDPYYLDGDLGSVRLYNRALSPSEVQQLYQESQKQYPDTLNYTRRIFASSVALPVAPDNPVKHSLPAAPVQHHQPINRNHPLNRDLLHWWKVLPQWYGGMMWRDLVDKSHGTIVSSDTGDAWKLTGAIQLDGNGYVQTENAVYGDTDFTFAAWVLKDITDGSVQHIFDNSSGSNGGLQVLYLTSNRIRVQLDDDGANTASFDTILATIDGEWTHVMVVGRKDGLASIYLDGQQNGAEVDISTFGSIAGTTTALFGVEDSLVGSRLQGQLADIRAWSRALSVEEVSEVYRDSQLTDPPTLSYRAKKPSRWLEPPPPPSAYAGVFTQGTSNQVGVFQQGTTNPVGVSPLL